MPRGSTEFEEKRIACDFQLVFTRISQVGWREFRDPYEYAYRAGFVAGRAAKEREQGVESISIPLDASVRETAGTKGE